MRFFIMIKIIGLDISSAVIGWALLEYDDKSVHLIEHGCIKPPKSSKGTLTYRVNDAYGEIYDFFKLKAPDIVASEAYVNKFTRGRSTARTIIVLSVFNEISSLACLRALEYEPYKYAVMTIRSKLSKLAGYRIISKDDCFEFVKKYFPSFKVKTNRNGKIAKESYDEADAIAVALTHIVKEKE